MKGDDLTSKAVTLQSRMRRAFTWLIPVVLGATFFFYGLIQIGNYGVTWDEPLHRNWGKIFTMFWSTGDRSLLSLMPGHGIEYGPAYYALNYVLSEWLSAHNILDFVAANHVLNLLTASFAVAFTAVLGFQLTGNRSIGAIAAALLMLYPHFLAHAQYNPKDIPLMAAILLTAIVFVVALRAASWRLLVFAVFLMGAAVAVKVSALLMAPVFGIAYVYWAAFDHRSIGFRSVRSQIWILGSCITALLVGAYLFWPDAWGDLLLIPRAIRFFVSDSYWPGRLLYFGREYAGAELPWHYTLFSYFGATPVLVLVTFFVGLFVILRERRRSGMNTEYLFLLLWIAFPLLYTLKPGLVRYDGIRQFFFVLPALLVVAAIGTTYVAGLLRSRFGYSAILFITVLSILDLGYEVAVTHPFEGSYRNEVIRRLYPSDMDRLFEIEYWGSSYLQGVQWLIDNADPHPVICVPTAGILMEWYAVRDDFSFECSKRTTYVMFFTRYTEAGAFGKLRHPVFSIRRMGANLLQIYKIQ